MFAAELGIKPLATPVFSQKSDGTVASFVKKTKRDYIAFMPKPDAMMAVRNLAIAFEHYNEERLYSTEISLATQVSAQNGPSALV